MVRVWKHVDFHAQYMMMDMTAFSVKTSLPTQVCELCAGLTV